MAYNSDGYIMLDFTEVDFRRTNQTIEGLFKRCVDVIGTNKFILVINANGRTPLPATCSFTNNQYVIDTVIYMFAVSSNDNLFIRRNDVPASDIIDDSSISVDKTWSSNKIDSELDGKQDTLTAGTNITIDENNVISSTGGAVIDDSVIVNNKVWSSLNTVEKLAPIDTIVNNPAVFNTSLELPLVECETSFNASEIGSGDKSPTNPYTLVGVDDVTITANGVDTVFDLDGTRYGGSVDLITGKLKLTWHCLRADSINFRVTNNVFYATDPTGAYTKANGITNIICSHYKTENDTDLSCYGNIFNRTWYIKDLSFNNNITAFKSFLTENNVMIAYQLATPIEIELTPAQIATIAGANSIESDTGNIKVSYRHLPIDLF